MWLKLVGAGRIIQLRSTNTTTRAAVSPSYGNRTPWITAQRLVRQDYSSWNHQTYAAISRLPTAMQRPLLAMCLYCQWFNVIPCRWLGILGNGVYRLIAWSSSSKQPKRLRLRLGRDYSPFLSKGNTPFNAIIVTNFTGSSCRSDKVQNSQKRRITQALNDGQGLQIDSIILKLEDTEMVAEAQERLLPYLEWVRYTVWRAYCQ